MAKKKTSLGPLAAEDEKPAAPLPGSNEAAERRANYNRIARQAELKEVSLVGLNYLLKPEYHELPSKEHKRRIEGALLGFSPPDEEGVYVGQFKWTVAITHSRKTLAKFEAVYIVVYSNIRDVAPEIIEIFMRSVGMATSYSYLRTVCAQLDWAGGMRLPPLPMKQFTPNV